MASGVRKQNQDASDFGQKNHTRLLRQTNRRMQIQDPDTLRKSYRKKSKTSQDAGLSVDESSTIDSTDQTSDFDQRSTSFISNNDDIDHYQCRICTKGFQTNELLSSHMYTHNETNSFQCNICDDVFSTSDLLFSHVDEHSNVVKPFRCGICNAGFLENALLLSHVHECHSSMPSLYKCHVCSLPFKEISNLITHLTENHSSKVKHLRCGKCLKMFSQENELSLHIKTHIKDSSKMSKCPICFSKLPASIIDKHISAHDNEKDKSILSTNRSHDLRKTKKKNGNQLNSLLKRARTNQDSVIDSFERADIKLDNYIEGVDAENECTHDGSEESVRNTRKRRIKCLDRALKKKSSKEKPDVKDTSTILAVCKTTDPQNGKAVYDCDVCGLRVNDRESFIQHRNDHLSDGKFCINCQQCSQSFDSFEELNDHIGPGKCVGYKCNNCEKSFSLEPILLTHKFKEHSGLMKQDGVFTCTICNKTFENKTAYIRHASSHSEDKCIQCKLCRHAFTTQETLLGHLRTTHSIIPLTRKQHKFSCNICGANFIKNEALSTHQGNVHNIENSSTMDVKPDLKKFNLKSTEPKKNVSNSKTTKRTGHWRSAEDDKKRRTCPICKKVFKRFKDVGRHIGTHTKPYLCSHCGKSFPYHYSLDAHIKAYHSVENPHKCETCCKYFSCERSLLIHLRIHTGEKPHQCHICHKSFRQIANLSMHVKLHSSDKPFKCDLCDYRCSHQGYLKRHMSTHSKEKKYMCPICNKGFTEKPNLNHHLKRHSKVKNHVCAVCGHRFAERYYLNNHMRIHTKEKPYICPVCNRAFTMRPNMVSHIKKTHPSYNYQPVRPSHKQVSDSNSNNITDIHNNSNSITSHDIKVIDTNILNAQDHSSTDLASTTNSTDPSCSNTLTSIYSNSVPYVLTTAPPIFHTATPPQLQPSQPLLPLHLQLQQGQSTPPSSNITSSAGTTDLLYQHLTNPSSQQLPPVPPRDLIGHFSQQHQRHPMHHILQDTNIQRNENLHIGPNDVIEQHVLQEQPQRQQQQYNINVTETFMSPHFIDHQRVMPLPLPVSTPPSQNFPTVPLAAQDYIYTYPSIPPSNNNFLPEPAQGLFTNNTIHQSSNLQTKEEEKL